MQHGLHACRCCGLAALPENRGRCCWQVCGPTAYSDLRTIEATWPGAVRCRRGCAISQGLRHQSRNASRMQALLAVRTSRSVGQSVSRSVSQSGAAASPSRFTFLVEGFGSPCQLTTHASRLSTMHACMHAAAARMACMAPRKLSVACNKPCPLRCPLLHAEAAHHHTMRADGQRC